MDNQPYTHTEQKDSPGNPVVPSSVIEVDAESMEPEVRGSIIPVERRLSWLAWLVALVLFVFNRKIGLLFFITLLVFRQFPTLELKNLPGSAGRMYRKFRSR